MKELTNVCVLWAVHVHVIHFNCTGEMSDMEMALNILISMYINILQMQI